jgi:hypothetical protein
MEEIMQEADLLRREIQQSHREPSEREHALLDAFEDRREFLKRREISLLRERRDGIRARRSMEMYGSAGYPEQGIMSSGPMQPLLPLGPPPHMAHAPMPMMRGPTPSSMAPPPGRHFPDGGRAMLGMGQPELFTRPPVNPMMQSNDSLMVPMFALHEDELEFMQGGLRHPMNSNEMVSEDMLSPNHVRQFHSMMAPAQNWPHFPTVSSKGFIHFSSISDDMWPSNIPDGS